MNEMVVMEDPDPPILAFFDFLAFSFSDFPCFFVRFPFLFQGFEGFRFGVSHAFFQKSKGWRVRGDAQLRPEGRNRRAN